MNLVTNGIEFLKFEISHQ